jgi:ferredoxin
VYAQVASQLESTIGELDELKARPSFLSACLECPKLKLELDVRSLNVKKIEAKLLEKSYVLITSSPCEGCVSVKGKLVHVTNENTMLMQDVAYFTSRLERTKLSEKMIEEDISWVDECVTRSIHKLGLGYERCENKGEISTKFVPSSTYNDEKETLKAKQIPYPLNPKPSFNLKRAQKQTTNSSMHNLDGIYTCMFCGRACHLDKFCFRRKRIEKMRFEYARNSYHDEFFDLPAHSYSRALPHSYSRDSSRTFSRALPCTSSRALPHFSYGPNHRSYVFGS